ncbi:MAG: hypothetical protein KBT03_04855 [Bacteroidales bacterium]|nr:hypothetical protein [Candidatus Scybalousia scybalohippi]
MALVPNEEQRAIIERNGFNSNYWLVSYEDDSIMVIVNKTSDETHTLQK